MSPYSLGAPIPVMNCLPDSSIPLHIADNIPYKDLHAVAKAACETIKLLKEEGLEVKSTPADKIHAEKTLHQIADPSLTPSKTKNQTANLPQTLGGIAHLQQILGEFDKKVVQSAVQLRIYVTNRLIQESADPDPKIRIRALELLGRISDVGLFTDRTEVTINHRSTTDLESKLKEKLQKLLNNTPATVKTDEDVIDVAVELGIDEEKEVEEVKQ